ncbi:MAG: tetratricopeptide repeat protein, partial [Leptospiraceae bacterium]|nr:tetratricopeptide repeat protein [Leptospiraceae bacterium]
MFYLKENALTETRKKAILRQLRSAELELLWCIYAKPDFIDAYLLLGWLYQYIDIRKETIVFPEFAKDRDVFRSFYLKTFPRKYLEENVDIYTHALEVTHKSIDSKSELSIHLNLANNYFLLNNFQKALSHYEMVEKLSEKILEHTLFETYTQETLFYFNYARALIYNGKVASAVPYLLRARELYYEKEYFPLVTKISSEQKKLFEEKFEDSKQKLALIHALLGLLYLELEKFNDAILSLETAISFNAEREYINNISLFNTIAICYQKIGEYPKSEKYLNLANREYTKRVSLWDAFDFSIWNVIYTDDIRVIGEGRFVGEFPLEFSNLLTQSIQIQ